MLLAGHYAHGVPGAIRDALRFKALRLARMQRRVLMQSILPTLEIAPIPEAEAGGELNALV